MSTERSLTHFAGRDVQRIDTQFVRCDNLTGTGVPAPAWIPEIP